MPLSFVAAAGDDDVGRAEVIDEAVVVLVVSRAYTPPFSSGETRIVLLCRLSVQLMLVYGPTTDGIDRLTLLIRRM